MATSELMAFLSLGDVIRSSPGRAGCGNGGSTPDPRVRASPNVLAPARLRPRRGWWDGRAMSRSTPLLALACTAVVMAGCGQSKKDKASSTVCSARADIQKQIDQLKGLTPSTATIDGVKGNLQAIQDDLKKMSGAQGELSSERKQQVQQANQAFEDDLKSLAGNVGSLSATDVKTQLTNAVQSLATGYQQAFDKVDC